jgi:hypothetical protein
MASEHGRSTRLDYEHTLGTCVFSYTERHIAIPATVKGLDGQETKQCSKASIGRSIYERYGGARSKRMATGTTMMIEMESI